jgi:hypothetical protein
MPQMWWAEYEEAQALYALWNSDQANIRETEVRSILIDLVLLFMIF